jgi:hypothetical protein
VFGSERTPAGQGREEGLLGRGELPWLKEDPALAGAPLLRAVEPGALDGIAGEQGGGAVGAGPVGEAFDESFLAAGGGGKPKDSVVSWDLRESRS